MRVERLPPCSVGEFRNLLVYLSPQAGSLIDADSQPLPDVPGLIRPDEFEQLLSDLGAVDSCITASSTHLMRKPNP